MNNESLDWQLVSREIRFSMDEFCYVCNVQRDVVVLMVEHGIVDVEDQSVASRDNWRFQGDAVVRGQKAIRLVRDLGVNWPGAALALELLDQLQQR